MTVMIPVASRLAGRVFIAVYSTVGADAAPLVQYIGGG